MHSLEEIKKMNQEAVDKAKPNKSAIRIRGIRDELEIFEKAVKDYISGVTYELDCLEDEIKEIK